MAPVPHLVSVGHAAEVYAITIGRCCRWVLEHLTFRSENRFQPVIEALAVIKQYAGHEEASTSPPRCPVDGVVLPSWRETVIEEHEGTTRINRQYYELCVFQRLERALKCKEVWVEGAYAFRNPSQDMPANWAGGDAAHGLLPDAPATDRGDVVP